MNTTPQKSYFQQTCQSPSPYPKTMNNRISANPTFTNYVMAGAAGHLAPDLKSPAATDGLSMRMPTLENAEKCEVVRQSIQINEQHLKAAYETVSTKKLFIQARIRVSLALLFLIGISTTSLLNITVRQLQKLRNSHVLHTQEFPYIYKVKLNAKGREILNERRRDIDRLCEYKSNEDLFVFTEENSVKPLSREHFQREINAVLASISTQFPEFQYIKCKNFKATENYIIVTDPNRRSKSK
jgi:hypothetical protein